VPVRTPCRCARRAGAHAVPVRTPCAPTSGGNGGGR
jgi:hypothetical protein